MVLYAKENEAYQKKQAVFVTEPSAQNLPFPPVTQPILQLKEVWWLTPPLYVRLGFSWFTKHRQPEEHRQHCKDFVRTDDLYSPA